MTNMEHQEAVSSNETSSQGADNTNSPSNQGESGTNKPASSQTGPTGTEMQISFVGDTSTHAIVGSYSLPNTGTMWYSWGLEGFLVAGISGVALWRRIIKEVHKQ